MKFLAHITVKEDTLKQMHDEVCEEENCEFNIKESIGSEFGWVASSGIELDNLTEAKNESHIQYCVAYTLLELEGDNISRRTRRDYFHNFEEETEARDFYAEVLKKENLHTANFCIVAETTG